MQFINNWSQPVTLAAGVTSLALDLPDGEYRLTLTDSLLAPSAWEVVGAEVSAGLATVTRALEGTIDQGWPAGSVIYCAVTAGVLAEMAARIATLEQGGSGGEQLTKDNYRTLVPSGYLGTAASSDTGGLQLFNRKEIGCLFYGSLTHYLALAPVYQIGAGPVVNLGQYQNWSLGAATCKHVYTVVESGKNALIGISAPAGQLATLTLSAESFGDMYSEVPADAFSFNLEMLVPTLSAGDICQIEFSVAGFASKLLTLDPVTRMWSVDGADVAVQSSYLADIRIYSDTPVSGVTPSTASFYVDGTVVSVPLSEDGYSQSSGIAITTQAAAEPAVFRLGRIGGYVVYAGYS